MVCNIDYNRDELAELCKQYRIAKLSFFGSVLRDDFDPDRSDIDVLIELEPGASKSLFDLVKIQDTLTELLGKQVHLSLPASLSRYFKDEVLNEAQVQYVSA